MFLSETAYYTTHRIEGEFDEEAVIAALSICCLMGVVTASAAEAGQDGEDHAAVDAADEAQKGGTETICSGKSGGTMKVR